MLMVRHDDDDDDDPFAQIQIYSPVPVDWANKKRGFSVYDTSCNWTSAYFI